MNEIDWVNVISQRNFYLPLPEAKVGYRHASTLLRKPKTRWLDTFILSIISEIKKKHKFIGDNFCVAKPYLALSPLSHPQGGQ